MGNTITSATRLLPLVLGAALKAILPVPEAANPRDVLLFVQLKLAPDGLA